jgi:hypothetical protein
MLKTSKIALIAAIAAVGIASPAFAQAVDHTGTLFASYYGTDGKQVIGTWAPQGAARQHESEVVGRGLYNSVAPIAPPQGYDAGAASQR